MHVQEATAVVLAADGQPEEGLVKLPAGVFYTAPGHQRLTAAFAQVQLDKAAAQARADALQQALIMREPAPPSRVGTGAVLAVAVLLLLGGGVVGAVIFH